jgi:hypothetical protein
LDLLGDPALFVAEPRRVDLAEAGHDMAFLS